MKNKITTIALCAIMALSLAACGNAGSAGAGSSDAASDAGTASTVGGSDQTTQTPNPWQTFDTIEAAQEKTGFGVSVPDAVGDYENKTIRACVPEGGQMLEVNYSDAQGERAAYIRKAPGDQDISGDYNSYASTQTVSLGELSVTIKGGDELVNLATWTDGGYSYAVAVNEGITDDDMMQLVSQVS